MRLIKVNQNIFTQLCVVFIFPSVVDACMLKPKLQHCNEGMMVIKLPQVSATDMINQTELTSWFICAETTSTASPGAAGQSCTYTFVLPKQEMPVTVETEKECDSSKHWENDANLDRIYQKSECIQHV